MKRKAICAFMVFAAVLTSCTDGKGKYRIGVSQCASGSWRDKVNSEMLAAQHLYEENVEVVIACANGDTERQIRQIDSLNRTGIDLLVVAPNETEPIVDAVIRTRQKGIPVVFFDRKANTEDYTAFIGGNNVEAGEAVGNYALQLSRLIEGHRPVVLEVTASMETSPVQERHKGFSNALKGHGEVDYFCVNNKDWTYEEAYESVKRQIKRGPKPDIIFCHNDGMGTGAFKAVEEAGLSEHVKILGIDGMPDEGIAYVQYGQLAATYVYPTHGEKIVQLALDILSGRQYERTNNLHGMMVTPENVNLSALNSRELIQQNKDLITVSSKLEDSFRLYDTQKKILLTSIVLIALLIIALTLIWRAVTQTRKANLKMRELNDEQTRFYTNASHQLRTPLTLIAGPVRHLIDSNTLNDEQLEMMSIVERNVNGLEHLISDVLNFRKDMEGMLVSDHSAQAPASVPGKTPEEKTAILLEEDDDNTQPTILVVDDNDDIRRYLRSLLAGKFRVLEAPDGQQGLAVARETVPDIILSDVMMPVMDGLEFCKHVKEDFITSHIPVILLTARALSEHQVEGFRSGADAYITKPFSSDLLLARIDNLLQSRQQLRNLWESGMLETRNPQAEEPSAVIDPFLVRFMEAIESHISDSSFNVEIISQEMDISRAQLYRKVKALTGSSPIDALRKARLAHARKLLADDRLTIAEIAYQSGFNSPSYFNRCFKAEYGFSPGDMRK